MPEYLPAEQMGHIDPKAGLERGAAPDLWRHTLSQIPSLFGRLVYLSSLRDNNTGTYEHFGLAQAFGEGEAARVLGESHLNGFSQWLCLRGHAIRESYRSEYPPFPWTEPPKKT